MLGLSLFKFTAKNTIEIKLTKSFVMEHSMFKKEYKLYSAFKQLCKHSGGITGLYTFFTFVRAFHSQCKYFKSKC